MTELSDKLGPHITIQSQNNTPPLEKCGECCRSIHCPFCSPWIFKPTVRSKVYKHLEGHKRRAVQHKDHTIYKCNLDCLDRAHFHCPSCKELFQRRDRFLDHLLQCVNEEEVVEQGPRGSHEVVQINNNGTENEADLRKDVQNCLDDTGKLLELKMDVQNSKDDTEKLLELKMDVQRNPYLPLSSLHLLVPPLRLMSACLWQVAQDRNVDQYDKLAEFITLVTEMVPELLNYKQKMQLILGLRARFILECLKRMDKVDCKAIQDHLYSFQQRTTNQVHEEDQVVEVEISKSAFVELVQTLLADPSEKDNYFKVFFSVQYGARFDTALQILVWEFFYRLEEFLPVPSFSQVFSIFDNSSVDYEFEQFASDPEDLKKILQHQQERQKLTKSEFSFTSDTILSTLASKQTSEDDVDQKMLRGDVDSKEETQLKTVKQKDSRSLEDTFEDDEETDDSSTETRPNSRLHDYGLSPLTSSPCSVEVGAAVDNEGAGEAAFQTPRCSVEGVKEHLDLCRNQEPSEDSIIQSWTGSNVSKKSTETNDNTCLECGKTFASRSSLKKHHLVHSSVRPFKCSQCHKLYKSQKDLNQHLLIHSKPKVMSFACSLCEKRFSSQALLTVHLRRHSGERPFACSHCDKRFLTNAVLKSHVRIHTGERPYACTFCDKKFTQLYPRTVHLRMHKKEKPYLCSTCGMSFCSSGALLVHSRTHTGERPYQCDSCEKGFATAVQLTVHRRFHTGERPYSCSRCDKSFHCSSGLKKHMRTHTGEKPHQCLTCHKTFSQKSNMRIHLKVHKNI